MYALRRFFNGDTYGRVGGGYTSAPDRLKGDGIMSRRLPPRPQFSDTCIGSASVRLTTVHPWREIWRLSLRSNW